ncbi:MAG: hypothetical protein H6722_08670 [Sandaracinus sp.]|nr:hypothetical protein [Sandaracinus sp.]
MLLLAVTGTFVAFQSADQAPEAAAVAYESGYAADGRYALEEAPEPEMPSATPARASNSRALRSPARRRRRRNAGRGS